MASRKAWQEYYRSLSYIRLLSAFVKLPTSARLRKEYAWTSMEDSVEDMAEELVHYMEKAA